ncbi:hypothetical protein CE91St62_16340 [Lachnospiraceae bacterium]|nr:hypothetical protein [Extibacter sp. GGCC_0201]BDF37573.1 hypothetical protein CE91St62_16340 [Lachnospiraceae bacterium]
MIGVVSASIGGLLLINGLTESYDDAVSKAQAAASQYAQTKGELQSVNTELSSVQSRIEELQSKGKLSFTEQSELANLQEQNAALEQRSTLLAKLSDAQKYTDAKEAANAMQKKSDSILYETNDENDALMASYAGGRNDDREMHKRTDTEAIKENVDAIKEYEAEVNKLKKEQKGLNKNDDSFKEKQQTIEDYKEKISKYSEDLNKRYANVSKWHDSMINDVTGKPLPGFEQQVHELKEAMNYTERLNYESDTPKSAIESFFSGSNTSGISNYLTELAKAGKSTKDIKAAIKGLGLNSEDFGTATLDDVARHFKDIASAANEAANSANKIDGSFSGISEAFQTENAGDAYEDIGNYLIKAKEQFDKGIINTDDVKSVAKLIGVAPEEIKSKFAENYENAQKYFTFDSNGIMDEKGVLTFWDDYNAKLESVGGSFRTTAEAASSMDLTVEAFEILMGRSQDHGNDFGDIEKSTEQLSSAKEALEGLKELKDSLNSEDREELSGKFDGWEEKLSQYEEDLSTIDPKIIAEIEFEYSLAQLESEIEEAELLAESTGTREAWGNSLAKKEFARGKLEDQNQFSEVVEPQEFPIYFGVESALHDVQEQIASGELDEDEAVRLAIKANNLEDFMLDIQTAFSEDNPTITPETNTEVADEAWQTWLSSTNGQQIIANILANNEEAISAVAELLGMTPEQVVRLIADSSNVDQAAANKDGGSRFTLLNPVSGELQAEISNKDGGTRNVKLLPNNQLLVTETTEEDGGERTTTYVANTLSLPSAFPTITRRVEYKPFGIGVGTTGLPLLPPIKSKQANGTAHSAGTALWQYRHSGSRSYSGGSWGLPHSERALINELGSEIIVRNGRWFTLNNGYPVMASLKAGDIVFNHKQSEALLSRGYVTGSHARLVGSSYAEGSLGHLSGRAYASGTEFKQEFDQIEILIDRMESAFKRISDSIETLSYNLTAQNKQVDSAIAKAKSNLSSYQKAYDTYMGKANAVGLSGSWVNAVQNGSYDVSTITDEDLKDKIDDYKKYYEKALGLQKDIADLQKDLVDLAMKKLSNIDSYFSNRFDYNDDFGYANQISELNSALSQYQNELAKQVSSGTIKQYSDEWYDAQKKIADYTQKILDATWKKFEDTLDHMDRVSDNLKDFLSLKEAKGEPLTEADYQKQIDLNNDSIQKSYDLRQQLVKKQAVYDVGSKLYDSLAKEIAGLDSDIYDLMENNEKLKKSIWETRFTNPFEEVIDGLDATISSSKNLRSLLDKDSFFDESGALTDNGLANLALLGQEMATSKQKVAEYTAALKKLDEAYQNGILSQEDYEKSQKNMLKDIQDAAGDVQDYKDKIIDLYKDQMKAEIDYMDDYYDKRQKALNLDKKYYDFSKKLNDRSKSVNQLKAQIAALQGVNNASAQAELRRLQQELAEKEEDLAELKKDHADDMIDRGYDKLSTGMKDSLNSTMDELTYNASKQEQVVADMLNKVVSMYGQAYGKINEIIANTGFAGSSGFHQNVTDLGTQSGAAGQMEAGSASQGSVQASGTTTGVDTGAINKNPSHDAIIEDISKETDLNNRPVAELTLSTTSLSLTEGKSAVVSARVRPTDAANKTLRWTSSNTKAATVSGGTIKGVKAGSAVITCTTTDGSGISATVSVSVARAPAKPAPSQNSPAYGGIPFRYKKDYYPKNKLNVNSSIVDRLKSHDFDSSMSACRELYNYWGGGGYYSGTYSQNVWLLNKMRSAGYRRGSRSVPISGPDFVHAGEIVIRKSDGGILVPLQRGDGVIPSGLTENLWDLAERAPQLLSGAGLYLPAPGRAHQPSGERGLQAQFSFGTLLNIEGNADKDIVDELKSALPALGKELTQIVSSELSDDYRKLK